MVVLWMKVHSVETKSNSKNWRKYTPFIKNTFNYCLTWSEVVIIFVIVF